MKKCLLFALSFIILLSTFLPGIARAEQTNRRDTAALFEKLRQQGIMEGFEDGSSGLDRTMTRAEFSAVLVRLLKLSPKSDTLTYTDTSEHWAHQQGYIEAVTKSKLMEGTMDGFFDPDGPVTLEQLAATLIRGLGQQPAADASAKGTVSGWAAGYVAAALASKLLEERADYTLPATREELVTALSAAADQLASLPQASDGPQAILAFQATGAKKLSIQLNQPVDPEKAVFEVKRGNTVIQGKTVLAKDNKSADILFESPLLEGTYSVELKGAQTSDGKPMISTTAVEAEKLVKLEFAGSSDTLAKGNIYVAFQARNQYGETSAISAASFDIHTSDSPFVTVSGKQAIKLDLRDKETNSQVSISIVHPDTGLTLSKTFAVGSQPLISSIEVGELLLPDSVTKLAAGAAGYLKVKALDQYGYPVMAISEKNKDGQPYGLQSGGGIQAFVQDASVLNLTDELWKDYDGDDFPELKIVGGTEADQRRESQITLVALGSGQTVTKTISLSIAKAPFSVEFGDFKKTVAAGDKNVILPLIVKDDKGQVLSPNEVAEGSEQLLVYSSLGSAAEVSLSTSGATRGLLALTALKDGSGTVVAQIVGTDKKASLPVRVLKERYPAKIMVKTDLAPYYVHDAEDGLVLLFKDQYGELIRNASNEYISALADTSDSTKVRTDAPYKIHAVYENIGDASENGALSLSSGPLKTAMDTARSGTQAAGEKEKVEIDENFTQTTAGNIQGINIGNLYNTKMSVKADSNKKGRYRITLSLVQLEDSNGNPAMVELDRITKTVEVIDETDSDLTYSLALETSVKDTIFAAVDAYKDGLIVDSTVTASTYELVKNRPKLGKELLINVKKSNQEVEIPTYGVHNPVISVGSVNTSVVGVVYANSGTAAAPLYKYYVMGVNEGTTTVTASYKKKNGVGTAQIVLKTSETPVEVVNTANGKPYASIEYTKVSGKKMWDYALMGEVILTDQYGSTYKNDVIAQHAAPLGLTFYATDIVYKTPAGDDTVTVDPSTGTVTYTGDGDMASFTLVIVAPSGKKVQTVVNLK